MTRAKNFRLPATPGWQGCAGQTDSNLTVVAGFVLRAFLVLATCLIGQGCASTAPSSAVVVGSRTAKVGEAVSMDLISNEENTRFRIRELGGPVWQEVGVGKFVPVTITVGQRYEIAAKPPGYVEKMNTLSQPLQELRFTFLIEDKEPPAAPAPPVVVSGEPQPAPPVPPGSAKIGQRWALVVGISTYHDSRIPALRYAEADAKAFHEWLISPSGGRYAPANVKLLLGKEATNVNIKDALFRWLGRAIAEDMVTIYFAGHGTPESPDKPGNLYLLPYDTDYGKIAATGFRMSEVERALREDIHARKVVVIADACHAGGIGDSFGVTRRGMKVEPGPINQGLQHLAGINDGVAVITSAGNNQLSQESERWGGGHGVFTHFLLKGLRGEADYPKDNRVTLGELTTYLSEQVRRETRNAQAPEVSGKFDPALTLGQ